MLLLPCALALAADDAAVRPFGWVRPGGAWLADSDANAADQDGFVLQARLGAHATLPGVPVAARVELDLLPEPALKDAFVVVRATGWLSVRAGQLKVPFSVAQLTSETRLQLPTPARAVGASGLGRDIGADVEVQVPWRDRTVLVLTSGVFDGEGPNRLQNVNERFLYAQRALLTPFGARPSPYEGTGRDPYLGVGGGWAYDYDGDGATATETNLYAAELQAAWNVASVQAEWIGGDVVHANPTVADYDLRGLYVQAGSFVPLPWARDHVEVVGRWERTDPNTAFGAAAGEATAAWQAVEVWSAGVNLYAWADAPRHHDLKLQAAWTHPTAREGEELVDDTVQLSATARF